MDVFYSCGGKTLAGELEDAIEEYAKTEKQLPMKVSVPSYEGKFHFVDAQDTWVEYKKGKSGRVYRIECGIFCTNHFTETAAGEWRRVNHPRFSIPSEPMRTRNERLEYLHEGTSGWYD